MAKSISVLGRNKTFLSTSTFAKGKDQCAQAYHTGDTGFWYHGKIIRDDRLHRRGAVRAPCDRSAGPGHGREKIILPAKRNIAGAGKICEVWCVRKLGCSLQAKRRRRYERLPIRR